MFFVGRKTTEGVGLYLFLCLLLTHTHPIDVRVDALGYREALG